MPSCDEAAGFVPLAGDRRAEPFRPLGKPDDPAAPVVAVAAEPAPAAPDPREEAFEAGRAQGRAEAAAEQAPLASDVAAALGAIRVWREELRTRYTGALVELALAVARRIVGEDLAVHPERWRTIVAAGTRDLVEREQVTVRVAPRLAALLRAHTTALAVADAEFRVIEDPSLADGACLVEGLTGDVDCGIDAQLATIADALGLPAR